MFLTPFCRGSLVHFFTVYPRFSDRPEGKHQVCDGKAKETVQSITTKRGAVRCLGHDKMWGCALHHVLPSWRCRCWSILGGCIPVSVLWRGGFLPFCPPLPRKVWSTGLGSFFSPSTWSWWRPHLEYCVTNVGATAAAFQGASESNTTQIITQRMAPD